MLKGTVACDCDKDVPEAEYFRHLEEKHPLRLDAIWKREFVSVVAKMTDIELLEELISTAGGIDYATPKSRLPMELYFLEWEAQRRIARYNQREG